jgi:hypothetical protein
MQVQIYPSKKSVQFVSCTKSVPVPTISLGIRIMGIVDGACVYAARILYNKLVMASTGDYISFPDDCNPSGLYKKDNTASEKERFDAEIAPNPTSAGFSIIITKGSAIDLQLEIIDALGKVILTKNVKTLNNMVFVSETFKSGVYIVKLSNKNNEIIFKKLLVQ